jgi:mono/diheme cytochrome c family protein
LIPGDCDDVRAGHLSFTGAVLAALGTAFAGSAWSAAPAGEPPEVVTRLLESSCSACHNSTDWAGGVAFDTLSLDNLHGDAEVWEEAIRKLRGRLMPPPGEKQPAQGEIDSLVGWLETRLDAAAAALPPDPGYVGLHRLNRNEYAREITRILDLSVDVTALLPKDVFSEGFDNQAATLRMSPSFLEQYITAARTVARQAIGRVDAKSSSHEYRAPSALDQSRHIDGLPLGTRGGFWVDHHFPADGEYVFSIREFFAMGAGYVTKVDHAHTVILTIDGRRVFQNTYGGPDDLKAVDQNQAIAADEIQNRFNQIRVPVQAGLRRIGVSFIQRSLAQSDSPLQPIAMLPEMERVPRIPGFTVAGPFNVTGVGDTPSRRRIFSCMPSTAAEESACARRILSDLAAAAFRRPVGDEDLAAPLQFYAQARANKDFEAGIEGGLTAILSSTKFLLRSAPTLSANGAEPLTDLELATRLAFFLWSAGPDQRLIDLATAGRLQDARVLAGEARRMLDDPRAQALVDNFAFQWLNVARMGAFQVDPTLYPDFDHNLRSALREEIRLFLADTLRGGRSVLDLLRADSTFLNERLARHYGVDDVRGDQFRKVRLADANRHGLLGKGALLMATSYGNRTSPVLRGAWVMDTLFGTPPTAPPPGVEQFPENEPGKSLGTVRERLEQHRAQKSCNACHGVIDPLGFALENFDVVGAWRARDLDAGEAIDARGQLASGVHVGGPAELAKAILARPDTFVQAFTEKLMIYALGRPLRPQDMPAVRRIVRQAAAQEYRLESLVQGIVASDAFRIRRMPGETPAEREHVAHAGVGR